MSEHFELACFCRAFVYTVDTSQSGVPPQKHTVCNCTSCRHRTGSLGVFAYDLPSAPPSELVSSLGKYTTTGESGGNVTSYFCQTCGTKVLTFLEQGGWHASAGALNQIEGLFRIYGHEWLNDTKDGGIAVMLPKIRGQWLSLYPKSHSSQSDGLEMIIANASNGPTTTTTTQTYLPVHCACTAFSVRIARPSPKLPLPRNAWWYRPPLNPKTGLPTRYMASFCACESCRKGCGAAVPGMPWVTFPIQDIYTTTDNDDGTAPTLWQAEVPTIETTYPGLTKYASSPGIARHFCSTCGATVLFCDSDRLDKPNFAVGLLDAQEGARADSWLKWWVGQEGHPNAAVHRMEEAGDQVLVEALKEGLEEWGKAVGLRT